MENCIILLWLTESSGKVSELFVITIRKHEERFVRMLWIQK